MKILSITPINHIKGLVENLEKIGQLDIFEDPSTTDLVGIIHDYDVLFTNPNKSKVYIGEELLKNAKKIQYICTASTGTVHIDKEYLAKRGIKMLSLTKELEIIEKISSTAEHAFALMMTSLRKIIGAQHSVKNKIWDYEPFIGRQMNKLNILVVGYGRLGKKFASYCNAFDANVFVYDPYVKADSIYTQVDDITEIINSIDIISLHVHVTEETQNLISKPLFDQFKSDVIIVNTSRGEIINESHAIEFLKKNKNATIATDVLSGEIFGFQNSELYKFSEHSNQVLITPHIAGMTTDAQEIAYNHAAKMLYNNIKY